MRYVKNKLYIRIRLPYLTKKKVSPFSKTSFINIKNPHLGPRIPFILLIFLGVFSKSRHVRVDRRKSIQNQPIKSIKIILNWVLLAYFPHSCTQTCIFEVLLAYFPHSCTQTYIFEVLLAYFPYSCTKTCIFEVILVYFTHSCTQTCISAVHLVVKKAIAKSVHNFQFVSHLGWDPL